MLWLNLILLFLFLRLVLAIVGLREDSCSGRFRSRWFVRWNGSGSAPSTPRDLRVPTADAAKPGDIGNAKEGQANCSQK